MDNITEFRGFKFDTKMAHLGAVLVSALDGAIKPEAILEKLVSNGILDSESNARYRATQAQSIFNALPERASMITLAGEMFSLAGEIQDAEADVKATRENFRVDVSGLDYSPERADVTNVTRWSEVLKLALDAAKAKAEASLNTPNGDGMSKLGLKANFQSALTGKQNALRTALDRAGLNTHNLTPDGKLIDRPASVKPKAMGARKTGKHTISVKDSAGNKRDFASKLEAAQVLTTEGAVPAGSFNGYQMTIYTKTEDFWAILAKSGICPA